MAQKRSFFKNDVRAESYMALSNNSKVLLWDLKANSDDYGFIDQMTVSKAVTETTDSEVNELINQGYLYDFGNNKYLLRWFQKDNNVPYQKTQQTICPNELQYVYIDDEYYYQVSSTPVRPIKGWNKIFKKTTKDKDGNFNEWGKEKDVVVPRDYLFEGKEEELGGDYKITSIETTPAKEVKQTPSVKDTTSVQSQPEEVAPAPQPTKQADKVNEELSRLDDETEQDNEFETKMKQAYEKGQEAREDTPQPQEQPVNPYNDTPEKKQRVNELNDKYKVNQQQDINPDELDTLVAGAQTRSMPDTQTVESTNSNDTDQKLTADGLPDFLDNEADKAEEEEKQARYKEQGLNEFGYTDMTDTSDLPF